MYNDLYKKTCWDLINETNFNWTLDVNSLTLEDLLKVHDQVQQCTERMTQSPPTGFLTAFRSVFVAYYSVVMVLGFAVNIALLWTIVRSRRLRTITNSFMCSLSVADLLIALIVIPLKIVEFNLARQYDVIDNLFPLLGRASLLNLCAVTVDRYISIVHALTYDHRMTKLRAAATIIGIWLLATLPAVLQFAFETGSTAFILFQDLVFVFAFIVPFVSVLFANGHILLVARKHAREIAHAEACNTMNIRSSGSFAKKMKIIRVLGILVGTFVVSWLPYCILTVYENHVRHGREFEKARHATAALACSTSLTNALLYGILRRDVREALTRSLRCQNPNQNDFSVTAEFTAHSAHKSGQGNSIRNLVIHPVPNINSVPFTS